MLNSNWTLNQTHLLVPLLWTMFRHCANDDQITEGPFLKESHVQVNICETMLTAVRELQVQSYAFMMEGNLIQLGHTLGPLCRSGIL